MIPTAPFGRTGHDSSRVVFGAAGLASMRQDRADAVLTAMRSQPAGAGAVRIGTTLTEGPVVVRTTVGARRVLEMPLGEQLPRIC